MEGECDECSDGSFFFFKHAIPAAEDDEDSVTYKVWMKDPETNFLVRADRTEPLSVAASHFEDMLPKFIGHHAVKRNQAVMYRAHIQQITTDLTSPFLILHFDFAENFHCVAQDEIQAAYYARRQVSVFTVVLWSAAGQKSMVLVSDDINHGKEMVIKNILFLFEVRK
jgi:hypothetical protein